MLVPTIAWSSSTTVLPTLSLDAMDDQSSPLRGNMFKVHSDKDIVQFLEWALRHGGQTGEDGRVSPHPNVAATSSGSLPTAHVFRMTADSPGRQHSARYRVVHSPYFGSAFSESGEPTFVSGTTPSGFFSLFKNALWDAEGPLLTCLGLVETAAVNHISDDATEGYLRSLIRCLDQLDEKIYSLDPNMVVGPPGANMAKPAAIIFMSPMAKSGAAAEPVPPRAPSPHGEPVHPIQFLRHRFVAFHPVDLCMSVQHKWFGVSRNLRSEVSRVFIKSDSIPLSSWVEAASDSPTIVSDQTVLNLYGLSADEDSALVDKDPRDWVLYNTEYYVPGGMRVYGRIAHVEDYVHQYITQLISQLNLPVATHQFLATTSLIRLVSRPDWKMASELPAVDFDPSPAVFLKPELTSRNDPKWQEIARLFGYLRTTWPRPDLDSKGIFGIDCLILRFLALARYPVAEAMSIEHGHLDGVDKNKLLPTVIGVAKTLFATCIARSKHTDIVALPMIIFHLISRPAKAADFVSLLPLLRFYRSNFNWQAIDRAAKLRAATAINPPAWWRAINMDSPRPVLARTLTAREMGTGSEIFNGLVNNPLDSTVVSRFKALEASGWIESEEAKSEEIQTFVEILRIIVESIQFSGDFTSLNRWAFVVRQYADDYNTVIAEASSSKSIADVSAQLVTRLRAVAKVATRHAADISFADPVEALDILFAHDTFSISEWGSAAEAMGDHPLLAAAVLNKMAENLQRKFR